MLLLVMFLYDSTESTRVPMLSWKSNLSFSSASRPVLRSSAISDALSST